MPPLADLRGFSFARPRTTSSLPNKIPTVRGRRLRIGLAPASGQVPGRPSDRHVGYLALGDRKLLAVLVIVEDATLSLSMKRTPWTSQPS
jgi:hypothetical protein